MITIVKNDKANKLIPYFTIIKVSMDSSDNDISFPSLLPPSKLIIARKQGEISKKKFIKEYKKYLKKSKVVELSMLNVGKALEANKPLAFTCTEDEEDMKYLPVLVEYISELFGVQNVSFKEAKELINNELNMMPKNQIKLLKKDEDELSSKKAKNRRKILKNIHKLLGDDMSSDGREMLDKLDRTYAVEQIIWSSVDAGVCTFKDNTISNIDETKIKKSGAYIKAIKLTSKDKTYKKIVNAVLEANSIDSKKGLKKLTKTQIVALCGEIVKKITEYRETESV